MKKRTVIGIVAGAIGLAVVATIAIVIGSNISNERSKSAAFVEALNQVEGVGHAQYELGHPGVPWHNSFTIFVAIDIKSSQQVADTIDSIMETMYQAQLKDSYDVSVDFINADLTSPSEYTDRNIYLRNTDFGGNEQDKIIGEAQVLLDDYRPSYNSFTATSGELAEKFGP